MFDDFGDIVLVLVCILVIFLCYYTTRFLGKKFSGAKKNKVMKIVETLPMGFDRCLYLIMAGKKYFLFYSSKKGLEFVSEVKMEDMPENLSDDEQTADESANVFSFKKLFEQYSGLSQKPSMKKDGADHEAEDESDRRGIAESIRRLQKLNSHKE